ncbi:type VI secretion system baseplate subunit TssF [Salmonella enterica]|nr:type VI secretion system baseplate subunit TssF [Salmonella enterica]EBS4388771.1 type VI secretion system baseplate subunit TssF [Salmonella enterica subsp. enterica serovar Panama]EBS5590099.1 type VI secretion system baseplate subunit TssF [Salmonella enterica subsp. enterica serovar Newport]ECW3064055.1 type VI secretion system baseplate subunit TssF [Salmonella enterica subsp. enterica serovar Rubislaw]EDH5422725.1 type VI secretion system baseplate subunit TssF [Salmonella enterica sub
MLLPQKILTYYNRELSYLRQYGTAFARRFPKISRRLGLAEGVSEDPHVERLVESFAFLTARIHQQIDEDMPELNNAIMEALAPQFIRQVPSVSMVQFQPSPDISGMTGTLFVPRHTCLISHAVGDVACRFRTAYPVDILPMDLYGASLAPDPFDRDFILTLRFATWPGAQFQAQTVRLYLNGAPTITHSLYELLLSQVSKWECYSGEHCLDVTANEIQAVGFAAQECLCADDMAINPIHHLFRDYFSLVEKFLFLELPLPTEKTIPPTFEYRFRLKDCSALRRIERICDKVNMDTFRLNCTPVVNLFPHQAEPLVLSETEHEYLVQPDVRRPYGMEVYRVNSVEFFDRDQIDGRNNSVVVRPLLGIEHCEPEGESSIYWQATQKASLYPNDRGMNMFIGFADLRGERATPAADVVKLNVMCTNRDIPQQLNNGHPEGDFDAECALPGVKVIGLIRPRPPLRPQQDCSQGWRMATQLNLNHMLLGGDVGAQRLRETLELYNLQNDATVSRLIALLRHIDIAPLCARLELADPYSLARGLEVVLTFQAQAEEYVDFYLFCSVLERFIALYAPVNSFTQVVTCLEGGNHSKRRWPRRSGRLVWL